MQESEGCIARSLSSVHGSSGIKVFRGKSLVLVLSCAVLLCLPIFAGAPILGGALPQPLPLFPADNWENLDIRSAPITVPLIGWTPKDRGRNCGFSIARYGAQQKADPYWPDCGNGLKPDGTAAVTGNEALYTAIPVLPKKSAWQLVWSDEFNGQDGSAVDSTKWTFDTGGGGWGNNELEYYTDRTDNAHIENGMLAIVARQETYQNRNYTSARLKTQGLFTQRYGKFEARIKLPSGQGIWPAFWMLGNDFPATPWPNCGEIDIMENIGKEPSTVHGTIHGPGSGEKGLGAAFSLPSGQRLADGFHVFAVEWDPKSIRWYVDGTLYETRTVADIPAGSKWVFDHPFFIILNLAVGGGWPGNPDQTTVFPQKMLVDYVRVYQPAQ